MSATLSGRRKGFTLIELMVVMGIMAVLIAILLPAVNSARRNAERNAARLDLNTIAIALEAYKKDFGDYPRPPTGPISAPSATPPRVITTGTPESYRVLAWALLGPYNADASGPASTAVTDPWGNTQVDGADGLGFRTTWTPAPASKGGRVYQPYLPVEKFPLSSLNFADPYKWDIMDRYGAPIEYFPRARRGRFDANDLPKSNALFGGIGPAALLPPVYNFQHQWVDNPSSTPPVPDAQIMRYLRRAIGDDYQGKNPATNTVGTAPNDAIDGKETAGEMPDFILLSRGPSRSFPDDKTISLQFDKCEAITNLQH